MRAATDNGQRELADPRQQGLRQVEQGLFISPRFVPHGRFVRASPASLPEDAGQRTVTAIGIGGEPFLDQATIIVRRLGIERLPGPHGQRLTTVLTDQRGQRGRLLVVVSED